MAQGSRIAFAPGKLDFASASGQALLGHELSHVVSQARGEVTGSGFLNDHALEARADREGAMAAAGEQVYAGPVTTALSSASAAPAAGPMQASKSTSKGKKHFDRIVKAETMLRQSELSPEARLAYQKQLASSQKWLKYWEQWITPEAANKQLRIHNKKLAALGQEILDADDLPLAQQKELSGKVLHQQSWLDFLYGYADDPYADQTYGYFTPYHYWSEKETEWEAQARGGG